MSALPNHTEAHAPTQLPVSVVSRTDVSRLLRELAALNDFLASNAIREPGTQAKLPKTSKLLDETFELNKLNPLKDKERAVLAQFLSSVHADGPSLHMSFSADPSPLFIKNLVAWLRQNIDPNLLLQVGLQPNIGAGCIVRTKNKFFDFSLRRKFVDEKDQLIQQLNPVTEVSS